MEAVMRCQDPVSCVEYEKCHWVWSIAYAFSVDLNHLLRLISQIILTTTAGRGHIAQSGARKCPYIVLADTTASGCWQRRRLCGGVRRQNVCQIFRL